MALLLGIDTGGTYTDAVLYDQEAGVLAKAKALTTKHDLAEGVGQAMARVLPPEGAEIALVSLSTTLATNALVEGHGQPVGLILAGYPPQALERAGLREALRGDPVLFIAGGHSGQGEPQAPLDLATARRWALEQAGQVQSFAVAGFFAVRNPEHELALRDLLRAETGLPVTSAHLLSASLDAPRRALTAVLNARLIPLIQQLIQAVQGLMQARSIKAPLMVVKGDGSLIGDAVALASPVETILSGPAASVVGARALAGVEEGFVSDIGGTTTDIALIRGGRPVLSHDGATVGGFRTMVEAIAVHTLGLGGDSEVRAERQGALTVGPRRAVPLSLLAMQHAGVLGVLEAQLARVEPLASDGRFALRLRRVDPATLKPAERAVWEDLAAGPQPLEILAANYLTQRSLLRLLDRGLVILSAFTPSDAAHLLDRQRGWERRAAEVGARHLACQVGRPADPVALAQEVYDRVVALSCEALVDSALAEEGGPAVVPDALGRLLLGRAFGGVADERPLVSASVKLARPVIGIGAPAATYYPEVARRLATEAVLPEHGDVCNAVGAVASGIVQRTRLVITQPAEGKYRAHLPNGIADFPELEQAAAATEAAARSQALALAAAAGADDPSLEVTRRDNVVEGPGGLRTFIESAIVATAAGRPRLAEGRLAEKKT